MKSAILVLMLALFTAAFYAVESPINMEITHPEAYVMLDWDTVANASSYKVSTCDTPNGVYELDETGIFPTLTSWTKFEPAAKQFYRVTASKIPMPVDLGTAADFVVLAKSAISSVPASAITGNVGISPAAATYITGFTLIMDPSGVFSGSTQVTGNVYAANYGTPTPVNLTTAIGDMETACVDAAGRSNPDFINLGDGDISGLTLVPGIYKWGGGVSFNSSVTLIGGKNDVWIFQIAQGIVMSPGASVILGGSAKAKNIFWQTAGPVLLYSGTHMEGNVLSSTNIDMAAGASVNGRLLAQTGITLDQSVVTKPNP